MDDLLNDFVIEASEHLDIVDAELVKFERDPNDSATLALIFRLVHTIKGTCGFLALPRLEHLAHVGEDVISGFRDGKPVTAKAVTMILNTIDRIKKIIDELRKNGTEPEGNDEDLISALRDSTNKQPTNSKITNNEIEISLENDAETKGNVIFQVLERPLKEGEISLDDLELAFQNAPGPEDDDLPIESNTLHGTNLGISDSNYTNLSNKNITNNKQELTAILDAESPSSNSIIPKQTVRVSVETLDRLMTMVSELVLTRNQLLEIARQKNDVEYKAPLQRLSHITAELQDGVMQTRMQPIGNAWAKLSRVVRDITSELGKKIELIQNGAETEIDRQLLEMIKDPLLHMVRNAADHGIEMPDERVALGKPPHGTISLRAAHENGYIIVEVTDDGRGIDIERVKSKVLRNGLATEQEFSKMSEEQILRFVMEPGFSTAAKITNISGRGVGLDVVKSHVEQVGGAVDIKSTFGKGLTVLIKLPLTLAIASALIIEVAGQRFAIPQISVAELVHTQENGEVRLETLNGQQTLRLRQKLLPVLNIAEALDLSSSYNVQTSSSKQGHLVVLCQIGEQRFGLLVDSILHTEEIVIKPICSKLRHMSFYSGATILGDGSVILIIEPSGIARSILENKVSTPKYKENETSIGGSTMKDRALLLLFRTGGHNLKAIPLSLIGRLEEFEHSQIEEAGGKTVVQYQGRLMTVLNYNPYGLSGVDARQPVLVFHQGNREIGMAVDEIVDVIETAITIDTSHAREGSVGAAIVDGKTVDIVDVTDLVTPVKNNDQQDATQDGIDVLLLEGSEFFRALLAPLLQNAGHRIMVVSSISAARSILSHMETKVFVLDFDQHEDDGFSFIKELEEQKKGMPTIGLVSKAGSRIIERGRSVNLHDLVGKFDRQGLLSSIDEAINIGCGDGKWGEAA